jgi:hypothetical protein
MLAAITVLPALCIQLALDVTTVQLVTRPGKEPSQLSGLNIVTDLLLPILQQFDPVVSVPGQPNMNTWFQFLALSFWKLF